MTDTRRHINTLALSTEHLHGDLGRRAAQGSMIAISAQAVRMLLLLANTAVLARFLDPSDFGLVAMATSLTALMTLFTDLGLSTTTIQRASLDQDTVSGLLILNLLASIILAGCALALAPLVALFYGDVRLTAIIIAIASTFPLTAGASQHLALLSRGMRWITLHQITLMAQVIGTLVGVAAAALFHLGYWSIVANTWASAFATFILAWAASPWRPSRVTNWVGVRSALHFG